MDIWKSCMWTAEWRMNELFEGRSSHLYTQLTQLQKEGLKKIHMHLNNSSLRNSYIWFSCIYNFIIILSRVYHEPIQRPAPSWLVSLIGRALHRYRRGQGFESRTSLNFFQAFFSHFLFCPHLGVSNTPYLGSDVKVLHLVLVVRDGVIQCVVDCMWIAFVELLLRT